MRYFDEDDAKDLNAEPWMLELLKLNPDYVSWGPHEDYMWKKGEGWDRPVITATWKDFELALDDLNECVNFYFSVNRASVPCAACDQSGYNSETKAIADGFYQHSSPTGIGWNDNITEDEVAALLASNRLHDLAKVFVPGEGWKPRPDGHVPTADEVNAWQRGKGFGHDAINRMILIETRAKRLGVYGHCQQCQGNGHVYTEPSAHVTLTLWILHPRKGCSRGWEVTRVEREDLPAVYGWLASAAARNAQRFEKVVAPHTPEGTETP